MNPALPTLFRRFAFVVLLLGAPGAFSAPEAQVCPETDSLPVVSLDINGLKTTRKDVVLRELGNVPGAAFSCARLKADQVRLEDLDIFAEITSRISVVDSQVRLAYEFRELPPYIPFVAVSKTEQDGLSLGPALASLNFLGQGIRAEFITRFGGTTEFQASLSSSRLGSLPLQYDVAVLRVDSYNHFDAFHEDSWRVKLDLAQQLGAQKLGGPDAAAFDLPEAAHLIYAGEIYVLRRGEGTTGILLSPNGDIVPRLAAGFMWDGRDRRHNPRRGFYQEARVTQSGGPLGGPADYREWLSDTRAYLPLRPRYGLALSSLYQYRDGEIDGGFGRYDRFHVGGINTLRGWPHDALRGKSEWILTLENRLDLLRKRTLNLWRWSGYYGVQVVLGAEAASLWDHHALADSDFHHGVYAGVHVLIAGVDRIRFECGSKSAKLQAAFDIGMLDKADVQRFRAR